MRRQVMCRRRRGFKIRELHALVVRVLLVWSLPSFPATMTAAAQVAVVDPLANVSTPLRESIRNRHANVTINVQTLDFQESYMQTKIANFERLTGATVNMIQSTQASWFSDIEEDIGGAGFIDLYAIFGNWIPTFVEDASDDDASDDDGGAGVSASGGLADITDAVANQVGLDWFDIMPAVRSGVASYKNKVYTVPLDGDVIVMLYRTDLVEGVGLPTPNTWEDVLEITRHYADADFTGDGVPDYANCFSTKENDIAGTLFWSIASTFLQTRGTSEGAFFDPQTFDPKSTYPLFLQVLDVYRQLVEQSPFRDLGPTGWQDNLAEFESGRCVLWYNYPGPTRILVSNQNINNMTGILNYAPVPGMKCTGSVECPFASSYPQDDEGGGGDGARLANHAPFLASGGMSFVVNARAPEREQRAALDFTFYLSDPAVSYWDVAYPGSFLDPLRRTHTVALGNPDSPQSKTFLDFGWETRQLPMLKDVTEFNFLHENYVMDLRILGANEYQEAGTVPHLIAMWNGDYTTQQTADAITASWNAITDKYGLKEQRDMYRDIIGLPPYVGPETTDNALRLGIIIPLVVAFGLLLIVLIVVVLKQHHTIRYKTRDIENAPKSGMIAVLFTDIEGSTALWEASKSVMSQALEVHHDTIRNCIQKHKAYEVKTIGDAFMIAVGCADTAVMLANDIQHDLLNADWPAELASMPSACVGFYPTFFGRNGHKHPPRHMFRGLRVRIGIHMGEHSVEEEDGGGDDQVHPFGKEEEGGGSSQIQVMYDKVTKGYDYYGPATNAAARIEAMGFGGQTLISSVIFDRLSEVVKGQSAFSTVGALELRGISQEVMLYQCLPDTLKGRRFQGVYRRRDSDGGSIGVDDNSPMRLGESVHTDTDLVVDVMTLTPVQLQSAVMRLRTKVKKLEAEMREYEMYAPLMNGGQPQTNGSNDSGQSSRDDNYDVPVKEVKQEQTFDNDYDDKESALSDET